MYKRNLIYLLCTALEDTPVVLITGARQTGKSTLCRQLINEDIFDGTMVTLDDPATLLAAQSDPLGFLQNMGSHMIIDEVQRAPELFLSIKKLISGGFQGSKRLHFTGILPC